AFDKPFVKNDRNLGLSYKPGMGMDLSELRLCEWRCFDAMDTMNNLYAKSGLQPKYLITDIDTYRKNPEDDLYPQFPVTYVKVDRKIIPATNLRAFGTKQFTIPFDATGKSWVRFAAWDSAGNGAFVQPIWLAPQARTGMHN